MVRKLLAALVCVLAIAAAPVLASGVELKLIPAQINVQDVATLQSGARTFVNYCLNCHSASLVRYNQLKGIGLTDQQIKDNLLFSAEKVGEPMKIAASSKDQRDWFGVAPPDLSLIARSRGADWLYNYLKSFYRDPERATGWNNAVFPNVAMPHVLWQLQGERVRTETVEKDASGKEKKDGHGHPITVVTYEQASPGSMSALEYDKTVGDLVNFMVWVAEPHQLDRKRIGYYVLMALGILMLLTYLLKAAYWKDVH
jgi:ubiquinol-cytochrome c reductase cytochrome c1 subunit